MVLPDRDKHVFVQVKIVWYPPPLVGMYSEPVRHGHHYVLASLVTETSKIHKMATLAESHVEVCLHLHTCDLVLATSQAHLLAAILERDILPL